MAEIQNLLVFMNEDDRERVMKRYESMFDQAGPEGEEILVRCFGSPVRQVLQIEQEYRDALDKGKTPFVDVDISLPTSGMEEYWQPEDDAPLKPQPTTEPASEGVRSIPDPVPEEPSGEPLIPEETPMEDLPAEEAVPPEPVSREAGPAPEEWTDDAATIPEIVPEEQIAEEIPVEIPASAEEKSTEVTAPAAETVRASKQTDRKPGAGRVFAAVLVTVPLIAMWALFFGLSIALGAAVMALGAAFAAVGIYLMSYLFSRMITYIPDVMLVAGGVLVAMGGALLLIWCGLWIAVGGCILTVRISRSIYRKVLGTEKEG